MAGDPKLISREEVKERVSRGELLVVHHTKVYKVPQSWLAHHPGGNLAILHFIGRDATDEIEAYHTPHTIENRMAKWTIGTLAEEGWVPLVPPIQNAGREDLELPPWHSTSLSMEREQRVAKSFRKFKRKVTDLGLLTRTDIFRGYGNDLIRLSILLSISIYFYITAQRAPLKSWSQFGSVGFAGIFFGLFWHQLTFIAHDAGHTGITGDWYKDRLWGIFIADFIGGLSIGWWCDNHNVHHLVTNHPEHDPDIQHIPFFALSTKFFNSMWSTYYKRAMTFDSVSRIMVRMQHKSYYFILAVARVNLFANSYVFLFKNRHVQGLPRKLLFLELLALSLFWLWWGYGVVGHLPTVGTRWLFGFLAFITASPVHVQILLSHYSQPTEDPGLLESFPSRQLRTTMDVDCPRYLDFLHGGLHMQVSHHLFPRIPRHNLRKVRSLLVEWCEQVRREDAQFGYKGDALEYKAMGWIDGNKSVIAGTRS
ncbi:fatty acid/sphingolipid desaturase [Atractiella rhizophila]|nr:fatty acid/sphingolipid desaturase [Atractiella rhizophila]